MGCVMSKAGSPKAIEDERTAALAAEFKQCGFPAPVTMFRLGDDELMMKVMNLAFRELLINYLSIPASVVDMTIQRLFNDQVELILKKAKEMQRKSLTDLGGTGL